MTAIVCRLAAIAGFSLAAAAAHAQSLTLDDFTAGATSACIKSGSKTATQTGSPAHLIGGVRGTQWLLGAGNTNTFGFPACMQVKKAVPGGVAPTALATSQGAGSFARLDVGYGSSAGTNVPPLGANFSAYDRFRIHFYTINTTVDFGILAFTGGAYSQWGCQIPTTYAPITVDLPFANGAGQANPAQIDGVDLYFQSNNPGGGDFAVTLIELVAAGTPAGDITCPPLR